MALLCVTCPIRCEIACVAGHADRRGAWLVRVDEDGHAFAVELALRPCTLRPHLEAHNVPQVLKKRPVLKGRCAPVECDCDGAPPREGLEDVVWVVLSTDCLRVVARSVPEACRRMFSEADAAARAGRASCSCSVATQDPASQTSADGLTALRSERGEAARCEGLKARNLQDTQPRSSARSAPA